MTTMKDVAKAAGVSIATVSRVLAGNVPVTESTQKKVYAAMEELQYHSSTLQHAPGKKNLSLVAVCVQDLSDPCCMDVLRGVEDVLSISGYLPLLFNVDHDLSCCRELLETLPAPRPRPAPRRRLCPRRAPKGGSNLCERFSRDRRALSREFSRN